MRASRITRWLVLGALLGELAACRAWVGPRLRGVDESSGFARSAHLEGRWWTHGDSGTPARLYAFDRQGRVEAELSFSGVENVDWEDIAPGPEGTLWIGDIGNNFDMRDDLSVVRVREPEFERTTRSAKGAPLQLSGELLERRRFRYPEQADFPASDRRFDAEGLFVWEGRLYLLTKRRFDTQTVLYRFAPSASSDPQGVELLEKIGSFDLGGEGRPYGGLATAASVSPDGRTLAVLSYHAIFLFELKSGQSPISQLAHTIDLGQAVLKQCEALSWDGSDLVVGNEDGHLFWIPDPRKHRPARFPAATP